MGGGWQDVKSEIPLITKVEKFSRQLDIQVWNSGSQFRWVIT